MIYAICTILLIVFIAGAYLFFKVTKLREINNTLVLCTSKINDALDQKLDLINKLLKSINSAKLKKKFNYRDDLNLYEKEKALFDISFSINKFVKENQKTQFKNKVAELNALEENLDGIKDFYNANVLNYNEIFLKPYLNKVYRWLKYHDYSAFKIRKLEEYEIFKL